jgi:dihydroorotate dehydrogenase electron transfer subunit
MGQLSTSCVVQKQAQIVFHRKVAQDHYQIRLWVPSIARLAQPGQFLHVLCPKTDGRIDSSVPMLRRPFSLLDADPRKGTVDFLYKVVGKGTAALTTLKAGNLLDCLGPLGRPFAIEPLPKVVWLVGGGVGIPPLCFLAKRLMQERAKGERPFHGNGLRTIEAFLGTRSRRQMICLKTLQALGVAVHLATDDGSLGYRGSVVDLVRIRGDRLRGEERPYLFVCGPWPMMAALARWADRRGWPMQVSLEERMGCAMGCCMGCVVEVATAPVHSYARFQRVCTEGPVFQREEILWR